MSMMDDIYSTLFPGPVIPPSDTPNIDHPVGTESTTEQSLTQPTPGVHEGFLSPEQHDAIHQALTIALGIGDGGIGKAPFRVPPMTDRLLYSPGGGIPFDPKGLNLVRRITTPEPDAEGVDRVRVIHPAAYGQGWVDPNTVTSGDATLHDFLTNGAWVPTSHLEPLPRAGGLPRLDATWQPTPTPPQADPLNANQPAMQRQLEQISPQFRADRPVDVHLLGQDSDRAMAQNPLLRAVRRDDLLDVRGGREGTKATGGLWVLPDSLGAAPPDPGPARAAQGAIARVDKFAPDIHAAHYHIPDDPRALARFEFDPTDPSHVNVSDIMRGNQPPGSGGQILADALKAQGLRPNTISFSNIIHQATLDALNHGVPPEETVLGNLGAKAAQLLGATADRYSVAPGARGSSVLGRMSKPSMLLHLNYDPK